MPTTAKTITISHVVKLEVPRLATVVGAETGVADGFATKLGELPPSSESSPIVETELKMDIVSALPPPDTPDELAPAEEEELPTKEEEEQIPLGLKPTKIPNSFMV